jgi:hypothetical protein
MFLVINNMAGIRGGPVAGSPSALLVSDVLSLVTSGGQCTQAAPCRFVFGDSGSATLSLAQKNVVSATSPTTNNQVTITRIHVHYRLSNGGGVQGVDVPFDFDTFSTTVVPPTGTATVGFELVRVQAKESMPLVQLNKPPFGNGGQSSVVADLTFFGTDQVGTSMSVTGSIQIEFGDWAD